MFEAAESMKISSTVTLSRFNLTWNDLWMLEFKVASCDFFSSSKYRAIASHQAVENLLRRSLPIDCVLDATISSLALAEAVETLVLFAAAPPGVVLRAELPAKRSPRLPTASLVGSMDSRQVDRCFCQGA